MASNRSSAPAPADDQALAETFDEEKAANPAEIRRPDRDMVDDRVQPVDAALTGARGERFGEAVASAPDEPDPVSSPDPDPADRDDPDRKSERRRREDKLDEAIEESFPASDPPPLRPGSGG